MERKGHNSIGPASRPPLYLGWMSSSTECEASRGMHMEHWGREGTPAQSDKLATRILTSNGVTDVDYIALIKPLCFPQNELSFILPRGWWLSRNKKNQLSNRHRPGWGLAGGPPFCPSSSLKFYPTTLALTRHLISWPGIVRKRHQLHNRLKMVIFLMESCLVL